MAGADMTVKASDTAALIKQWRASSKRVEQVAAELAAKINAGRLHRYEELPLQAALAKEYDVSERTISSVKRLLAVHDFLTKENRRYYIA
jgi:DNA-binding GntR family transcriptional regulator